MQVANMPGKENTMAAASEWQGIPFAAWWRQYGVPAWLARGVVAFEGNVPPYAVTNDVGDTLSVGPLQLNTGGQARGWDPYELAKHPEEQAKIGIPPIAEAYKEGVQKGLKGYDLFAYVLSHSGHPGGTLGAGLKVTPDLAAKYRRAYLLALQESGSTGGPGSVTSAAGPAGTSAGGLEAALLKAATSQSQESSILHPDTWLPRLGAVLLGVGVIVAALVIGLLSIVGSKSVVEEATQVARSVVKE